MEKIKSIVIAILATAFVVGAGAHGSEQATIDKVTNAVHQVGNSSTTTSAPN